MSFCLMYFFGVLMSVLFLLNLYYTNLIFWWSVFLIMTLIYLFLSKSKATFSSMINYFIIQEFLGFVFLFFGSWFFQLLVLLFKVGISPFHFWIYSVVYSLDGYMLVWFLTFQKLPFVSVISYFNLSYFFFILLLGILFCYFQIFYLKNYKLLFLISSTESFSWVLFGFISGFFGVVFLFIYYMINMLILMSYLNLSGGSFLGLETVLVFLNIPFSVTFFVKIFSLYLITMVFDILILFLLMMMFLSSMGLVYWFSNFSMLNLKIFKDFYLNFYFIIYFLFLFIVF